MVRSAIEALYQDVCTVTVRASYNRANHTTGEQEQALFTNQPCKLSFSNAVSGQPPANGNPSEAAFAVHQQVKLFISPDLDIPAGSKITVTHKGRTVAYTHSGESAIFSNHQEILLELFKRWA